MALAISDKFFMIMIDTEFQGHYLISLCMEGILFVPSHFGSVSLDLKWVSCKQHL